MIRVFVAGPPDYVDRIKREALNIDIPFTAQAPEHVIELLEKGVECHVLLLGFTEKENKEILTVAMRYGVNFTPFVTVSDYMAGYINYTPYSARVVMENQEVTTLNEFSKSIPIPPVYQISIPENAANDAQYRIETVKKLTTAMDKELVLLPPKVISFFDFKGGVGKTTLTVATGKSVAALTKKKVCIIDLDVSREYGDVVKYLNVAEHDIKHTAVSWQRFPWHLKADWETVEAYLVEARDNLFVLPGIAGMSDSGELSTELVLQILDVLKRHFTLILFDLGNSLNNLVITAMEASDEVFLVNKPSEPEMKSLITFVQQTLPHLRINKSQISLIYSLAIPGMKISARDLLNSNLGLACIAEIPRDNAVELAICNESYVPYIPKEDIAFTRELEKVLYKIYPREVYGNINRTNSIWSRLFKKRTAAL